MSDTVLDEQPAVVARRTHRNYTLEFKRQVIHETLLPGASVSVVARRRDINANVVFEWRKLYREGKLGPDIEPGAPAQGHTRLLPVSIIDSPDNAANSTGAKQAVDARDPAGNCEIEIEMGKRVVRIRGLSMDLAERFLQDCLK